LRSAVRRVVRGRGGGGRIRGTEDDGAEFVVRVEFVVDGGEGAEFEAGDISEDGGAAGGDAVLDEEAGEFGEEVVDLGGGAEVGGLVAEGCGEIGVGDLGVRMRGGVARAELRIGVAGEEAAAGAVWRTGGGSGCRA
jgi:hypothetical protein